MRYIFLIHHDVDALDNRSKEEEKALTDECIEHDEKLIASGNLVLAHAMPPSTAKLVRRRRKVQITDGPFAESKEQLIGLLVIDAASDEEAFELAAGSPLARTGTVEVRKAYDIRDGAD